MMMVSGQGPKASRATIIVKREEDLATNGAGPIFNKEIILQKCFDRLHDSSFIFFDKKGPAGPFFYVKVGFFE